MTIDPLGEWLEPYGHSTEPAPPYSRLGNRVSLLPITQHCAQAGKLSAQHGAGRAAAMGSAGHALMAKQKNAKELLSRLTPQEREQVESWAVPTTVHYADGVVLDYESSEKELELGLDEYGYYVLPTDERCISIGHLDFAWIREVGEEKIRVAFIGDIKKTSFATADGPESLQLHAYAHAYASKHSCQAYCTGLWIAEEGEWIWSKDMVVLGSERQLDLWERCYHAITNTGDEFSFGPHCSGCYARLHCPEFAMPIVQADSWLGTPLDELLPSQAGALVLKLQAFEKMADKLKAEIQERVKRGALTVVSEGKRWAPVESKGRRSVDLEALQRDLGAKLEHYMKRGANFSSFRWIKK